MEKIKILMMADTHLGYDYPVKPRIVRRRRGYDFFNNFHTALEYAAKKKVDAVIHGGDLFFRTRIPAEIIRLVYADLNDFSRHSVPMFIVPGNHESSRLPKPHRINQDKIRIFHQPTTYNLKLKNFNVAFTGFPFQRHDIRGRFNDLVMAAENSQETSDIKLLILHQAIEGAKVGPSNYTFRQSDDVISGSDIPAGYNAVLSGHIHRQQILDFYPGGKHVPVIFPGSIERTAFAEKDEQKGFYILEFSKGKGGSIELQPQFIRLPARPMVDLMLDTDKLTDENITSKLEHLLGSVDINAIVRLKCQSAPPDWLIRKLTSQFLRSIFPPTMNYTLSNDFYPSGRFKKTVDDEGPKQARLEMF